MPAEAATAVDVDEAFLAKNVVPTLLPRHLLQKPGGRVFKNQELVGPVGALRGGSAKEEVFQFVLFQGFARGKVVQSRVSEDKGAAARFHLGVKRHLPEVAQNIPSLRLVQRLQGLQGRPAAVLDPLVSVASCTSVRLSMEASATSSNIL